LAATRPPEHRNSRGHRLEKDRVLAYETLIDRVICINLTEFTIRNCRSYAPHRLGRPVAREPGLIRVAGMSP
jgi:hypothetical protein